MTECQPARPWYCRDEAVDEYRQTIADDGDQLPMIKTLKILRAIVVNVGIIAVSGYALKLGGDPTLLGLLFLLVIAAYNGLEYSDYLALLQAYQEIQDEPQQ